MAEYPRGKLNSDDQGALAISVFIRDNTVIIDFGKDVKWVGMPADTAEKLAAMLIEKAAELQSKLRTSQ